MIVLPHPKHGQIIPAETLSATPEPIYCAGCPRQKLQSTDMADDTAFGWLKGGADAGNSIIIPAHNEGRPAGSDIDAVTL